MFVKQMCIIVSLDSATGAFKYVQSVYKNPVFFPQNGNIFRQAN